MQKVVCFNIHLIKLIYNESVKRKLLEILRCWSSAPAPKEVSLENKDSKGKQQCFLFFINILANKKTNIALKDAKVSAVLTNIGQYSTIKVELVDWAKTKAFMSSRCCTYVAVRALTLNK